MILLPSHRSKRGSALLVVIALIFVMSVSLLAIHNYTDGVGRQTGRTDSYLFANEAAGAAADVVIGRLIQWINLNSGYTPSIADCATLGTTGNSSFPAIIGTISFPAGSQLSNYQVTAAAVYPVMPDDTIVTSTSSAYYLTNVSQRINLSDNSINSPAKYYFTHSASQNAKSAMARSMTYQITVSVAPKVASLQSSNTVTLIRYLRIDKISPFGWCTYRNGSATYENSNTYSGPLYVAETVTLDSPTIFTDTVLYGVSAVNGGASFPNGSYASEVKQTSLLSLVPGLTSAMAVNSSGQRQASYETDTTPGDAYNSTTADPADMFSTREVIEPPTVAASASSNGGTDLTPTAFQNARIFNQADVRIKIVVTGTGSTRVVTKTLVDTTGKALTTTPSYQTALFNAINVNTTPAGTTGAFIDHERSTTQSIQSTDINVGALATVMNNDPTDFPTGIIYVWDASGPINGVTPLTGVRVWNAGVLPNVGLELGTDDPIYMKGDFNTGATLPANATINTAPTTLPYSDTGMGVNNNLTTESQREVSGYTIEPAGLFGDSITELSNAWTDTNSASTQQASNTTYNLVEAWSTMSANELRSDDTYLDTAGRANPLWDENWANTRRTMSGEEMCVWHSKYGDNTTETGNGGWSGDISYDAKATNLKLNWGSLTFVRDRVARQ